MKHKKLKKVCEKRITLIRKNAEQYLVNDKAEEIHQLRVGFKKLRAFTRLIHLEHITKKQAPLKKIKELYKAAGVLRDLQIYHKAVASYFNKAGLVVAEYPDLLLQRTEHTKRKVHSLVKDFSFDALSAEFMDHLPPELHKKTIRIFIIEQVNAINKLLRKAPTDENIHALRKRLKDILYTIGYLIKEDKKEGTLPAGKEKKLQDASVLLGDYIDCCVMLRQIRYSAIAKIPAKEKSILMQLKKYRQQIKNQLKKKIAKQFYAFKDKRLLMLPDIK